MTRAYITAGVILAGAAASCLNWHLALPLIAVWALLFFLHWLPFPRVARLTLTLALSQSLYCILIACLPRAPFAVSLACGALLILIRFI